MLKKHKARDYAEPAIISSFSQAHNMFVHLQEQLNFTFLKRCCGDKILFSNAIMRNYFSHSLPLISLFQFQTKYCTTCVSCEKFFRRFQKIETVQVNATKKTKHRLKLSFNRQPFLLKCRASGMW